MNKIYYECKQDMIDEWHNSNKTRIWCEERGRRTDASYWKGRCSILAEILSDDGDKVEDMKPSWELNEKK